MTMKKILITLMLCCSFAVQVSAQEIYKEVKKIMDDYETIKNDTTKDLEVRKVATFKWDAIYYMILMGSDKQTLTEHELGTQVSSMIEFVNIFFDRMKKAKRDADKAAILAKFKAASRNHIIYGDTDKEAVNAYVDHPNFLTQFSLDTDWTKALEDVTQ